MRARLEAFWLAWKYVLLLLVLLAVSLFANYRQWRASIVAPLKVENRTLTETLATTNELARHAHADNVELLRDLGIMVDHGRTQRIVYRDARTAEPLDPRCAPGQARVDAVNRALGPVIVP